MEDPMSALEHAEVQVSGDFYNFADYVTVERWGSYWRQIAAVLRHKPESVLEIGPGMGVTTQMLRQAGVRVITCDHNPALGPDVAGDVRELDRLVAPKSVDLVCAFQILEHLPFEDFETALAAIGKVARRRVILSLPHFGYPVELRGRFWKNRFNFALSRRLARPRTWAFDGQHHWELGTRGHSVKAVTAIIARHFRIERAYFCPEYSYHYFFECEVTG
jgi:hypothetical protein